jgi:hypothetical protein
LTVSVQQAALLFDLQTASPPKKSYLSNVLVRETNDTILIVQASAV